MTSLLRTLAVVGGLLLGLVGAPAIASADYAVVGSTASLRAGPGPGYPRVATIPAGQTIWVNFCRPKWCSVVWRNLRGWVSAALLEEAYIPQPRYNPYFYYEYDFGFPYPYPWPYPHKPPHCKPGKECPPPCKPGECKPWPKPGNWPPPKEPYKPEKFGPPHMPSNDGGPTWKKVEHNSDVIGGPGFDKPEGNRYDEKPGSRERRRWDE